MSDRSVDVSSEPFFSAEQLRKACIALAESYRHAGTEARWTPTKDSGYLAIHDTFQACHSESTETVQTDYHIFLSPTWQIPILYFAPRWSTTLAPLALKEVYTFLVDESSKDTLEDVGVMGGISHGDHPLLGIPFYFIHPCRTADLLEDIKTENSQISSEELLQVWLGLVGEVIKIPALPPPP